jgi:hypothetical protein
MKKIIYILRLFAVIAVLLSSSMAQSPWKWAAGSGGNASDDLMAIGIDGNDNIYICGNFVSQTFTIGGVILTNNYDPNLSYGDIFLAKYDSTGTMLWAEKIGSDSSDCIYTASVDAGGNTFVTGSIADTNYYLSGTKILGSFAARFDSDGNAVWVKSGKRLNLPFPVTNITGNGSGSCYVAGIFNYDRDTMFLDSFPLLNKYYNYSVFLAEIDGSGKVLWAKTIANADTNNAYVNVKSIATDGSNIYVTGGYEDTVEFDATTLIGQWYDIYLMKFDGGGNMQWISHAGDSLDDESSFVTCDADGNSYLGGHFMSSKISFGPYTFYNPRPFIDNLAYLVKFDGGGNVQWAKCSGGIDAEPTVASIAADASKNIYITGSYSGTLTFDSDTVVSTGSSDIYIAKFDAAGNTLFINSNGSIGNINNANSADEGRSVAIGSDGYIYLGGVYSLDTITFGTTKLPWHGGGYDVFLAKLNNTGSDNNCDANFMITPDPVIPHYYICKNLASGEIPMHYYWNWGDGQTSTGEYPSHLYAVQKKYQICLTIVDSVNCSSMYCDSFDLQKSPMTSVTIQVVPADYGISENDITSPLHIYPDPARDMITIEYPETSTLELYNLQEQLMTSCQMKNGKADINISSLSPGLYLMKFTSSKGIFIRKFIKE